jgi:Fe-S cluster assembly iron-binding protein IscA
MSFQKGASDDDVVDNSAPGFEMYYDKETEEALADCVIEFIDDPNFGTGLTIRDPNLSGCASCGGGCR